MTTANRASQTYPPGSQLRNQAHTVPPAVGSIIDEVPIDRILECAVILSWSEIMPPRAGLIYVEYGTRTDRSITYLKIWSCIRRGYWDLVCEYLADPGPFDIAGLSFSNGYSSPTLAPMLTAVMRNQGLFSKSAEAGKQVVIQVYPPDAKSTLRAEFLRTRWLS